MYGLDDGVEPFEISFDTGKPMISQQSTLAKKYDQAIG